MSLNLARRTTTPDLGARLTALAEVVELAHGRLDPAATEAARSVVARAGARLALSPAHTVVALAGGTGSGKSSLFNALAGQELATTGVRRPTTSATQACVWGPDPAEELLDWVGAARRHRLGDQGAAALDGLVLLDLPDHDSTARSHQLEVDRLVQIVDVLVWVLDPQKYADAAIHDRYLRPLAGHAAVMVVLLNQVDLLGTGQDAALADVGRLLAADGLHGVPVIATSARTGEGLEGVRRMLAERVTLKAAASQRLAADVDRAVAAFEGGWDRAGRASSVGRRPRAELIGALASAAGSELVVDAVVRDHRREAAGMTGWPYTSWLRKLRPDPLRRLHLTRAAPLETSRTSLPEASVVQRSRVSNAISAVADSAAADLPGPWPRLARHAAAAREPELADALDRAVAGATLTSGRQPAWWSVVRVVQLGLAAAAAAGALWLLVLFVFSYFRLPEPPTPQVGDVPWPTLLLLGGALTGLLIAAVSRYSAKVGASRRGRKARRELEARVTTVADELILRPLEAELAAYQQLGSALAQARGQG